jgi:hypothetical protein
VKVISIIQPWATLIALGEKKFETRSWSTKYRGELAIHSSKKIDKDACSHVRIRSTLAKHGYTELNLPTGVIIATCTLADCFQVTQDFGAFAELDSGYLIEESEYWFGDYSKGRFAWELLGVHALDEYIPAKGKLNLWEYPLAEMVGEAK